MKTKALIPALATAAVFLVLGCKEPLDVGAYSVSGTWKGTAKLPVGPADTARYTFTFTLKQNQRAVKGTAVVKSGTDSVATKVSGIWDYPRVTLQLTAPQYATLNYAAQFVTRDSLSGPLSGSGLNNVTLAIVRQP
ncbi:MAG: hypothetical protein JO306_02365 [Gemmatimonadetes bacterium]|nr:hypothetical protein [Gemmatimonadota bacterium]